MHHISFDMRNRLCPIPAVERELKLFAAGTKEVPLPVPGRKREGAFLVNENPKHSRCDNQENRGNLSLFPSAIAQYTDGKDCRDQKRPNVHGEALRRGKEVS